MATNISAELRQAVADGLPVEIIDSEKDEHFVLIRKELYDKLMSVVDFGEPSAEEKQQLLQQWGQRAGWEDADASAFDDLKPQ